MIKSINNNKENTEYDVIFNILFFVSIIIVYNDVKANNDIVIVGIILTNKIYSVSLEIIYHFNIFLEILVLIKLYLILILIHNIQIKKHFEN